MSTRALVGHYTTDGAWRAVWVHCDGGPEELGVSLASAVHRQGGDIQRVLDHVFSTNGWTSWPDQPHHPDDPDDVVFTPENVFYDFHWFYLFDLDARRMDVIPAGRNLVPVDQVQFAEDGSNRLSGGSPSTADDLPTVWSSWRRTCPPRDTALLDGLFEALHITSTQVGVGVKPSWPSVRTLTFGRRACSMTGSGSARDVFCADGRELPFPDFFEWFAEHEMLWTALKEASGLTLYVDGDALWQVVTVVERVDESGREISLEDARDLDPEAAVGDYMQVLLCDQSRLAWHWLFDQAWSRGDAAQSTMPA